MYAIPLNAVSQIARTFESEVHQVDNYEVLQLRNQVLPLLRLGRPPAADADRKSRKLFILVIHVGEKKYGLAVDALEGEEELGHQGFGRPNFRHRSGERRVDSGQRACSAGPESAGGCRTRRACASGKPLAWPVAGSC